MTVYEMESFLRGNGIPGDLKANESNAQYLVRKFSELQSQNSDLAVQLANAESKCRVLAAENVTVKECASDVMRHVYRSKTYLDSNRVVDAIQGLQCAIERKAGKTPATDTFLAEVRAQGVEVFASKCKEESKRAHSSDARDSWWVSGENADDFASQLRKGAQS